MYDLYDLYDLYELYDLSIRGVEECVPAPVAQD